MKFNAMAKFSFAQKIRVFNNNLKDKLSDLQKVDVHELFTANKDMIMKGSLWGLSITALIISMANIKTAHDAKVNSINAVASITSGEDTSVDTTVNENYDTMYENIQTAIDNTLQTELANYINNYVNENGSQVFFTKDTISTISTQVENSIISQLKETTNNLSSAQETIIRQIISEQIEAIDYSTIEKEITTQVENLSTSSAKDLEEASKQLSNEITAKVSAAVSSISSGIADELTSKSYTVGEYVTVDGKLYECIEDCTISDGNIKNALTSCFKEASLTTALANVSSELKNTIDTLASNTDEKISTLANDTSTKMNVLESSTNSRIDTLENSTNDKINTLTVNTNTAIEELTSSVDTALNDLTTTLTNEMNAKYDELAANISNNYNELSALSSSNSQAITNLQNQLKASSGTNFQFGYSNGAYGYYVNGTFYPF